MAIIKENFCALPRQQKFPREGTSFSSLIRIFLESLV